MPDGDGTADAPPLAVLGGPGSKLMTIGNSIVTASSISVGPSSGLAIDSTTGGREIGVGSTVEQCSPTPLSCRPIVAVTKVVSIYPSISPSGDELAFVEAPIFNGPFSMSNVNRWNAAHTLAVVQRGATTSTLISAADGASVPTWSANGKSLMYIADNGLWLLTTLRATPIEIAYPLLAKDVSVSWYGQIFWSGQFAWSSGHKAK